MSLDDPVCQQLLAKMRDPEQPGIQEVVTYLSDQIEEVTLDRDYARRELKKAEEANLKLLEENTELRQLKAELEAFRTTNRDLHRRVQRAEADAEARVKKKLDWDNVSEKINCMDWVKGELKKRAEDPDKWFVHSSAACRAILANLRLREDRLRKTVESLYPEWFNPKEVTL